MISDKERQLIRRQLELELENTRYDVQRLEELTQPIAPDNAVGRLSRMDAINNKSVNEATLESASARLISLEQALSRIDSPDFGNCNKCGQAIPVRRLLVLPESNRCVSCATRRTDAG